MKKFIYIFAIFVFVFGGVLRAADGLDITFNGSGSDNNGLAGTPYKIIVMMTVICH